MGHHCPRCKSTIKQKCVGSHVFWCPEHEGYTEQGRICPGCHDKEMRRLADESNQKKIGKEDDVQLKKKSADKADKKKPRFSHFSDQKKTGKVGNVQAKKKDGSKTDKKHDETANAGPSGQSSMSAGGYGNASYESALVTPQQVYGAYQGQEDTEQVSTSGDYGDGDDDEQGYTYGEDTSGHGDDDEERYTYGEETSGGGYYDEQRFTYGEETSGDGDDDEQRYTYREETSGDGYDDEQRITYGEETSGDMTNMTT